MSMPVFDPLNEMSTVEIEDIYCIYKEPDTRKIVVHTVDGEFYLPSTIEQVNKIMEKLGFCQIDKNKIVNVDKIKEYKNGRLHIDGRYYIVSKRRRNVLENLIEKRSRNIKGSGQN